MVTFYSTLGKGFNLQLQSANRFLACQRDPKQVVVVYCVHARLQVQLK